MRSRLVLASLLVTVSMAPVARADTLSIDVSGRCVETGVRIDVDGLPETDETEQITASACEPGDNTSTPVGIVETWQSWECDCLCVLGPDEGKAFACGEDTCDPMSKELCTTRATGLLDVSCDDLAGYNRICVGESASCNPEHQEGCGSLSGNPSSGGSGNSGCNASLGTARRGILLGFVLTIASALVMLRRRRDSA